MIVSVRTPLRVSLFGGGTDYPAFFHRAPGAVLGFTIDKYIYLSGLPLSSYVDYRYRLSYSKVEVVDSVGAIEHPVVRAVLERYGWDEPTDFSVQADLPAAAGLGSSSAFTVGFVNLISHLMGVPRTRMELAREAIYTEQVVLRENVGVQDQLHASFGGINRFDFVGDTFRITPINISGREVRNLSDWLVLVYTGIKRRATSVVEEQLKNTSAKAVDFELREMLGFVDAAQAILEDTNHSSDTPARIAELLHQSWQIKKRLSSGITLREIDELYEVCLGNGALGGKLCGAGGGGFLLMVVPPEKRNAFEAVIGPRQCVRFQVDLHGTTLIPSSAPPVRPLGIVAL
jgi:D-glycero-alpha-D-manno-heptose-7-phosphate kinase